LGALERRPSWWKVHSARSAGTPLAVHAHEVEIVRPVGGAGGIDSLVRVGHRVEEGLEAPLGEDEEGVLERMVGRTAEHRMLQDVGYSRGILRRRGESEGEQVLLVVVPYMEDLGAGGLGPEPRRLWLSAPPRAGPWEIRKPETRDPG
jgi:hypothetical protein